MFINTELHMRLKKGMLLRFQILSSPLAERFLLGFAFVHYSTTMFLLLIFKSVIGIPSI
jgi:hypothetical protein